MITAAFLGITGAIIGKNMFKGGLYKAFLKQTPNLKESIRTKFEQGVNNIFKNNNTFIDTFKKNPYYNKNNINTIKEYEKHKIKADQVFYKGIQDIKDKNIKEIIIKNYKANVNLKKDLNKKLSPQVKGKLNKIETQKNVKYVKQHINQYDNAILNQHLSDMLSTTRIATIGFDGTAIALTGVMGWNMKKEGRNV